MLPRYVSIHLLYRCLSILLIECAADNHPSDLACAGSNLVQLRISEQSSSRDLVNIPVSTHQLYSIQSTLSRALGSVQDCAGAVLCTDDELTGCCGAIVNFTCSGVGICSGGSQLGVHIRELALNQLVVRDGGAELLSDVGVGKNQIEGGLHDSGPYEH